MVIESAATHHIQKIAPGPPQDRAIATPAMFPVPTREASPTAKAWNEEIPPAASPPARVTSFTIAGNSRTWRARERIVNQSPAPTRSTRST